MSLPKYPDKHGQPSVFTAQDLVAGRSGGPETRIPEGMVICFQDRVFQYVLRKFRGKASNAPFGKVATLRQRGGVPVGIAGGFGIGAPAAVFMLEWLAAMGARRFIAIGSAGGLHEARSAGERIVCSAALRDEGASHHYLPAAEFSRPDEAFTSRFRMALDAHGYAHEFGPTWTTDAPLRETFAEIELFRDRGILTVDMEAAALFAAAEYLHVACAAAFAVSDAPRAGRWRLDFDRNAVTAALETLADVAVAVLSVREASSL